MIPKESSNLFGCCRSIFNVSAQLKKLLFLILLFILFCFSTGKYVNNYDFDYLIFSQRWLPTACIEYMDHNSGSARPNHCILPKNYDFWAIHGLWPTQENKMGPFFCNKNMIFDVNQLKPIESELKLYWPNIEDGKDVFSLWHHEWSKHGTCAAQLKSLDKEIKYFNTTMNLFKTYKLGNLLKRNSIIPCQTCKVTFSNLFNVIQNGFGKVPQIHCIKDKSHQFYLSEIRLCFNKNLEFIDCGKIHNFKSKLDMATHLTNCPLDQKILYPSNIEPQVSNKNLIEKTAKKDYYDSLFELLRIIRFLQWSSI